MTLRLICIMTLLSVALSIPNARAQSTPNEGAGPYPSPRYSCTNAAPTAPPRTFSLAYQPFPEPYDMFGAQLSEIAEEKLAALGLSLAPRNEADIVLSIRYAHARVGETASHDHYAYLLVGTCPVASANNFATRQELLSLIERYVRGELESDVTSRTPQTAH